MVNASSTKPTNVEYVSIQFFLDLVSLSVSSAFLGSSQKVGARLFSSNSSASRIFLSMSKMPPQRFLALAKISQLFNINHSKNFYEDKQFIKPNSCKEE
jgi:hypothetical protein